MSNIENKTVDVVEEERKFWLDQRVRNIFNLFVQGKDIASIAESLAMKPVTVAGLVTNRYFITKLEAHIRGILFTNQVAKVIASADIFSKLWDRVTNNFNDIPPEICLKELTKLFPQQKREGMIINPKNMNVFMEVLKGKTNPEDLGKRLIEDVDDLGYDGLEEDSEAIYPELGEDKNNGEQQRDPEVDPGQQGKDE